MPRPRLQRLVALIFCLAVAGLFVVGATGAPSWLEARPDPAEAALLHPIERVAFSDDWRFQTVRSGRRGDAAFVVLRTTANSCTPIRVTGATATLWQMHPVELAVPSSEGGKTGTFYDLLTPRTAATCSASRYVLAEWTVIRDQQVAFYLGHSVLTVESRLDLRASARRKPFLVGQSNANLIRGHCPDKYCAREAGLGHQYAAMLRQHNVHPMQNWVIVPPIRDGRLDLDAGSDRNQSFRQLVMAYAPDGMIGFPRARRYGDGPAYLQALETTVREEGLIGKAWVYAVDEPSDPDALERELSAYRLLAPSVRVMVTTNRDSKLDPFIDIYAPVLNHLVSPRRPDAVDYADKELWSYISCQGSCGPNRASTHQPVRDPGPDTGLPDLLIDRPAQRLFDWFDMAAKSDVSALFYYEATEPFPLIPHGIDPVTDPWNFGGNGDGLLVYPGRSGEFGLEHHAPLPSFRLKLLRHGIQTRWLKGASS